MKTINCFIQLYDLSGKPLPSEEKDRPFTLGHFLVAVINTTAKEKNFPPLKAYDLSSRLYKENFVQIDDADFIKLKELVEQSNFPVILIGNVLKLLSKADVVLEE